MVFTAVCSDNNPLKLCNRIGDDAVTLGKKVVCIEVLVYLETLICEFDGLNAVEGDDEQGASLQVLHKAIPAAVEQLDAVWINDSVGDFICTISTIPDSDAMAGLHGIDENAELRATGWDRFQQNPVMNALEI